MQSINVIQLAEKQRNEAIRLIDVRTPVEFREVHADGAHNIPLDTLDPQQIHDAIPGDPHQPLYVICRGGNRSTQAVKKLMAAGFDNVVNVEGGTTAWDGAGLPVRRGKKAVSLERQVRIAAGFLVLLGSVLGFFYPPFIGLAAFVGAGLMFAGITDTCGMAMVLAKMPWNQCGDESAGCAVNS